MARIEISREIARRFILGDQGLWPGRRWSGLKGTDAAMRAIENLQLDPLDIGARAHDFILHSRVWKYEKSFYDRLVYDQRKFFEWGTWLATRPIEEWPHWRTLMNRREKLQPKPSKGERAAEREVLEALTNSGPKMNRDFVGERVVDHYRGRKTTALALYRLWIRGEIVTSRRDRFLRVYDLAHRFIPDHLHGVSDELEADLFHLKKMISFQGIGRFQQVSQQLRRDVSRKELEALTDRLLNDGTLTEVFVEGWKERHFVLTEKLPLLKEIVKGKIPRAWKVRGPTTLQEVSFLSPLDIVSARGRAKKLFDFDYVWEVYKPAYQRKWGYYTLPILWGDQLVGRAEPTLDRETKTLKLTGLWLDHSALKKDKAFKAALDAGLQSLARLTGAERVSYEHGKTKEAKRIKK